MDNLHVNEVYLDTKIYSHKILVRGL